jgi:hypothetical protein
MATLNASTPASARKNDAKKPTTKRRGLAAPASAAGRASAWVVGRVADVGEKTSPELTALIRSAA